MESMSWYQKGMEWRQNACHNVKNYVTMSKCVAWCQKVCEIRYDVKSYVVTYKSMSLFQTVSHGVKRYLVIEKKYVQNVIKKVRYNVKKYIKVFILFYYYLLIISPNEVFGDIIVFIIAAARRPWRR